MDINMRVGFDGMICEVQILIRSLYELKNRQAPVYEVCRSLDLIGTLSPKTRHAPLVTHAAQQQMALKLRVALGLLRFWVWGGGSRRRARRSTSSTC